MNKNIILAGVGGQGILTIAAIIDLAAMNSGLHVKQAEVHGMSQRGGAVESHLRISDMEIYSDLIPLGAADVILSVEPMEALRYLPFLSPEGTIVTSTEPFVNIVNYPDLDDIKATIKKSAKTLFVDAGALAREVGNLRTYNIVMLGAASPSLGLATEQLEKGIETLFQRKGKELVELNLNAFHKGLETASH
jgi:indolepyruvate ferredoxin oxidoreductase beta subunit